MKTESLSSTSFGGFNVHPKASEYSKQLAEYIKKSNMTSSSAGTGNGDNES